MEREGRGGEGKERDGMGGERKGEDRGRGKTGGGRESGGKKKLKQVTYSRVARTTDV